MLSHYAEALARCHLSDAQPGKAAMVLLAGDTPRIFSTADAASGAKAAAAMTFEKMQGEEGHHAGYTQKAEQPQHSCLPLSRPLQQSSPPCFSFSLQGKVWSLVHNKKLRSMYAGKAGQD